MANRTKWQETEFSVGETIKIHEKIKEGEKERVVFFEGVVISIKGRGINKTITVRKIAVDRVGVEKIFPLALPTIINIEVVKKVKKRPRRARLYYLRDKKGK